MDAYKMLNLRDQKRRGYLITDEMVLKNFLEIKESYLKMCEKQDFISSQSENSRIELEKAGENLSKVNSEEINAMVRRRLFRTIAKSI